MQRIMLVDDIGDVTHQKLFVQHGIGQAESVMCQSGVYHLRAPLDTAKLILAPFQDQYEPNCDHGCSYSVKIN